MKKITQAELDEMIILHSKWLNEEEDGIRANFIDMDLSELDLSYKNLTSAGFMRTDLSHSKLICTNFTGANLCGAKIVSAITGTTNFTDVIFKDTDFSNTNIKTAIFSELLSREDIIVSDEQWKKIKGRDTIDYTYNHQIILEKLDKLVEDVAEIKKAIKSLTFSTSSEDDQIRDMLQKISEDD